MKRDELKVYTLENVEAFEHIISDFESWESEDVFKRDEADSVMDALENRIKVLEGIKHADMVRIAELERQYKNELDKATEWGNELIFANARIKELEATISKMENNKKEKT